MKAKRCELCGKLTWFTKRITIQSPSKLGTIKANVCDDCISKDKK